MKVKKMKNKKHQKIIICLILLIIISSISPVINANTIKKSESIEETTCLGSIYGNTGELYIWGFSPVRFAKVTAGGRTTISGPIMGEYKIRGLPLGTYTVTGSKKGYETYSTTVILTEQHPDKQVFIDLQPTEETNYNNCDSINFGIVFGSTMWVKGWAFGPLRFARIHASGENYERRRISGLAGNFILIIPLNTEITITASKAGYETETRSITLTNEKRYDYLGFMMNVL